MHAECKYFDLILGKRTAVKKVIKPAVAIAEWKHEVQGQYKEVDKE